MALNKIFIHKKDLSYSEVKESGSDITFIRKDALLEWLQKEYETHAKPGELHISRCEAYKKVIDKLEAM